MLKIQLPNLTFLRIARFVLGISFVGEAIASKQWLLLILGGFFLYQSVINVGCSSVKKKSMN
tara:strand:- start:394 stop:579 length:186 start_codon:yes stop_codon:yes gene_type:complete